MTPKDKYGRTEAAPVRPLDPVEMDFAGGKPLPPGLGKTDIPVRPLPELAGEMRPPPVLTLTLWVRPGASSAEVAADLFGAWRGLNGYVWELLGAGLVPAGARSERTAEGEVIRLVLAAGGPGTAGRLAEVRDAVNAGTWPGREPVGPSFTRWAAEVSAAA
jgi:hypothetical protein